MKYAHAMARMLRWDFRSLQSLSPKQLQYVCIFNVLTMGLVYGLSAFFFSSRLLGQTGVESGSLDGFRIILAGIPAAFLMHAGLALFIWVFLKAVGGKADFLSAYFFSGIASITLWPLMPFLCAFQTGLTLPALLILAGLIAAYSLILHMALLKTVFEVSQTRIILSTSVTVIYIACFLYLWL